MPREFEDIVRHHSAMVYRLAFSRLRNAADAEDVCQTVFLRLHSAAPTFTDAEHERAWLLRTTVNCCTDLHRSAWRRHVTTDEQAKVATQRSMDETALRQQSDDNIQSYLTERIGTAMDALSEKQRTAVHLFYFEELTCDEIAETTGERPATVRSHLRRARKTLQRLLGDAL